MSEEILNLENVNDEVEPLPVFPYAHVSEDGTVIQCSIWDGVTDYTPPEGHTLQKIEDETPVSIGWALRNGKWVDERVDTDPVEAE